MTLAGADVHDSTEDRSSEANRRHPDDKINRGKEGSNQGEDGRLIDARPCRRERRGLGKDYGSPNRNENV